jgi:hypothetical protein
MRGMATYRIILGVLPGFTAEVTYHSGRIEILRDCLTESDALDWIGDRLVEDIKPAREA